MSLPLPDLGTLLVVGAGALMMAGALSPFEAMGWWAGWFGPEPNAPERPPGVATRDADAFVVFLSGIHSVRGESFAPRERRFLARLREDMPDAEVLEVFPYSVTNRALTAQRVFSWFWRWTLAMKLSRRQLAGVAGMLINVRNGWQVAVSADRRYGPMYNQGSADLIAGALLARGYDPERGAPVVLIGYSGGGQVALGASAALHERFGVWPVVVSLGGVVSSDPALEGLPRLYHLRGRKDVVERLGSVFFPGRWPVVAWSSWNGARATGAVRIVDLGSMDHTGVGGYLDEQSRLPDGRTYLDATVATIVGLVRRGDAAAQGAGAAPA